MDPQGSSSNAYSSVALRSPVNDSVTTLTSPNIDIASGGHHATHRAYYSSHPFSSKSAIEMQHLGTDIESQSVNHDAHADGQGKMHDHEHAHGHAHGITERVEERYHRLADKVEDEIVKNRSRRKIMWDRFRGKTRRKIGWLESASNTIKSSGKCHSRRSECNTDSPNPFSIVSISVPLVGLPSSSKCTTYFCPSRMDLILFHPQPHGHVCA